MSACKSVCVCVCANGSALSVGCVCENNNFGERIVFSIQSCVSWFVFALAFLIYLFVRSNDSKHLRNIALFSVYRCCDYAIHVGWSHTHTHAHNGVFHIDVTFIWLCLHYFIRFSLFSHFLVWYFCFSHFSSFLFLASLSLSPLLGPCLSSIHPNLARTQYDNFNTHTHADIISRGQLIRIRPLKSSSCTSEGYHKDMILTTA